MGTTCTAVAEGETEDPHAWIGMACFLEGIDPADLGLPLNGVQGAQEVIKRLKSESESLAYYQCMDALSKGECKRVCDEEPISDSK